MLLADNFEVIIIDRQVPTHTHTHTHHLSVAKMCDSILCFKVEMLLADNFEVIVRCT